MLGIMDTAISRTSSEQAGLITIKSASLHLSVHLKKALHINLFAVSGVNFDPSPWLFRKSFLSRPPLNQAPVHDAHENALGKEIFMPAARPEMDMLACRSTPLPDSVVFSP